LTPEASRAPSSRPRAPASTKSHRAARSLGNALARLELRAMFEELLRSLPGIELASDEHPNPTSQ
jgi:hypothetical protein